MRRLIAKYPFSWARIVSDLLSPPMVWAVLALPIALRDADSTGEAVLWTLVYVALVCLLPLSYIGYMVYRGRITDMHMRVRQQRLRPLAVSVVCTGIAWGVLRLLGAPAIVQHLGLITLVQIALMALITYVWQISFHTVSISGATVAAGALFGLLPALLTLPLVLLVGAARLKLKRHTPAQVVAGAFVGGLIPLVVFFTFTLT
jgi:membrane-associated phospholipid phosphatase